MSGITGIYLRDGGTIDPETLRSMNALLAHRGPDAAGSWHDGSIGLGHRMLWTTPESLHERLPISSDDGHSALTADARIDNRDELMDELGSTSPTITDSELILRAYERWGEHCPEHLLGDFAFALWDGKKRMLFCARDHMGVKPLYYYRSDALFALASEIKALLCLPDVPRELNEVAIAYYLAEIDIDPEITSYEHVFRLPAAHTLTITADATHCREYWSLDPTREIRFNTDEEYEHAFREIFTEAVRCRLRSAFPVGAELSGGLDSSSVVCVARDLLKLGNLYPLSLPLPVFSSVCNEVKESDERSYISVVVSQGDLMPHYVPVDQSSPLVDLESRLWHDDEALVDRFMFIFWPLYRIAQNEGIRILLDGYSGDAALSYGSCSLGDLIREGKWFTALKEGKRLAHYWGVSVERVFWTDVVLCLIPIRLRQAGRRLWTYRPRSAHNLRFIRSDVVEQFDLARRAQLQDDQEWTPRTSRGLHYDQLTFIGLQLNLESLDKAAGGCGLELRHPFFDRRVVEFCLALPAEQKIRGGYVRAIIRYALSKHLPEEIQKRSGKTLYDPVFHHCMLAFERACMRDVLFKNSLPLEKYIDISSARAAYQDFLEGEDDVASFLWRVIVMANWLHKTSVESS